MKLPVISVLMPVYKTAPYLREAVDSILSQTYTDFELIVLNDCSPDNAEEILDTFTDSRIVRYKGATNVGLSNILNVGMKLARGRFIARMDSDDLSYPERLQIQLDYLETHPEIDLVSAGMQLFGAKEEIWIRDRNPEKVKIEALFHSPILHASSMWRKDSFERNGLCFRQEMVPSEDYDLWTRAMVKGLILMNLPKVLYKYRIHSAQATTNTKLTTEKDRLVQQNYLRAVLPSMSDRKREAFPEKLWPVFWANVRQGFFDRKLLAQRLYKMQRARKQ